MHWTAATRVIVVATLALCLIAAPAVAQNVYGGSAGRGSQQSSGLTASFTSAVENGASGATQPDQDRGSYTGIDVAFQTQGGGEGLQFGLTAGTSQRHYAELTDFTGQYSAGGGLAFTLGGRTTIQLDQGVSYSPFYEMGLLSQSSPEPILGAGPQVNLDQSAADQQNLAYQTSLTLTQSFGRRSALSVSYSLQRTDFQVESVEDSSTRNASISFSHGISRYAALRLGYSYREQPIGLAAQSGAPTSHDVDVGIDYSHPLSLSRSTTVNFSTGSSIVSQPQQGRRYELTGDATLVQEIGRTWQAQLQYSRGVEFIEVLAEPAFPDTITASLGGSLGRRTRLSASTGYSTASIGLTSSDEGLGTYQGSVGLQVGLTQRMALDVAYSYYSQEFSEDVTLPDGLAPSLDRSIFRIGLSVWSPLF